MQIVLKKGEQISVVLEDTDGEFIIEYGEESLTVVSDLPDSSGREGEIYREDFMEGLSVDEGRPEVADECYGND